MKKILLVAIVVLLFTSCNSKQGIKVDETNKNCEAKIIPEKELSDLLYNVDLTGIQFIDIRTPHQFAMGHLTNAINIPQKNFFDEDRFEEISKDAMLILYGEDASSPKMMALMAGHFNKGDFYIATGGYDYIKEKMIDGTKISSTLYNDETPLVDYQKAIDEIKKKAGVTPTTKVKKKVTSSKPIIKRKKKEVSGGCG